MGTLIIVIVYGALFAGPCITAYLAYRIGRRLGWNDCVRAYNAAKQNNSIDWILNLPPHR